jgi:hypothetical protein
MPAEPNRYYPSPLKTKELHNDFRQLFDHVYALQDELASTKGRMAEMETKHGKLSQQIANGPSTTKIAGLNVKGTPPAAGTQVTNLSGVPVLGYNSATGDIEFMISS